MSTYPGVELAHRFFTGTGTTYDRVARLCTIGFDIWWKKKILEKIPRNPFRIIDQACGTGILTFKIAQRFMNCRVTGVELRDEYLNIARQKAMALKLSNVAFVLGRAEDIVLDERVDCITSSYLAKYAEMETLVGNAEKMVRPGGLLIMHDFTYPSDRIFARIWDLYFRILQTAGAWKYPQWRTAFCELPKLLRKTDWVTHLLKALEENAFTDIQTESLTLGTSMIVSGIKKV